MLLSLMGKQHCIIEGEGEALEDLGEEVKASAREIFGLKAAVVECRKEMTMEDFWGGIMVEEDEEQGEERMVGVFFFEFSYLVVAVTLLWS